MQPKAGVTPRPSQNQRKMKALKKTDNVDQERSALFERAAQKLKLLKEYRSKSKPIFNETDNLLLKAGDKLQYIVQGDYIPETATDFMHIDAIVHHMYRMVRLAGMMGIKVDVVWEKTAGRHGIKMEMPDHLKNPDKKRIDDLFEDAEIIN